MDSISQSRPYSCWHSPYYEEAGHTRVKRHNRGSACPCDEKPLEFSGRRHLQLRKLHPQANFREKKASPVVGRNQFICIFRERAGEVQEIPLVEFVTFLSPLNQIQETRQTTTGLLINGSNRLQPETLAGLGKPDRSALGDYFLMSSNGLSSRHHSIRKPHENVQGAFLHWQPRH